MTQTSFRALIKLLLTLRSARLWSYFDARVGFTDQNKFSHDFLVYDILAQQLGPEKTKNSEKIFQTAFGVCPTVYKGRPCRLGLKKVTDARVGSYRPMMPILLYFLLIHKKIRKALDSDL